MKIHFWFRKVLSTMFPVLIPLLILGILSLHLTQQFSLKNMENDHQTILMQMDDMFSMVLDDLDSLHSFFATKASVRVSMKSALNAEKLTLENSRNLSIVKNYLSSLTNTKAYLQNIHLYFQNNYNRYISDGDSYFSVCTEKEPWLDNFTPENIGDLALKFRLGKVDAQGRRLQLLWVWLPIVSANTRNAEGVIAFCVRLDHLEESLTRLMPDTLSGIAVYAADGTQLLSIGKTSDNKNVLSLAAMCEKGNYVHDAQSYSSAISGRHGMLFVAETNAEKLGFWSRSMLSVTLILICASLLLALCLGLFITKREARGLHNIEQTLMAYERGEMASPDWDKRESEYSNIMRSAVNAFLQKNYLQVQLENKSYQMRVLELMALQTQINPHFLFNTLNSIQWKCIALTDGPNPASRMIENLAAIFDYTLENTEDTVTLERDLHYVQCYVEIERQRFSDIFSVSISATEEAKKCRILKMLIQPVLENALRHGLNRHRGKVNIQCEEDKGNLRIVIEDDGKGIPPKTLSTLTERLNSDEGHYSRHIGLLNTQKRIRLAYGEAYGITLESEVDRGTRAIIVLPAIHEQPTEDTAVNLSGLQHT